MIHRPVLSVIAITLATTLLFATGGGAHAQDAGTIGSSVERITADIQQPVKISGDFEYTLASEDTQAHLVTGHATLTQGILKISGMKLAVFVVPKESGYEISVYGEDVSVDSGDGHRDHAFKAVQLESLAAPQFNVGESKPGSKDDPLLRRAVDRLDPVTNGEISTVSLQLPQDSFTSPLPAMQSMTSGSTRRVQVRPRSSDPLRFESFESKDTVPAEQVTVITGGVNVLIEGVEVPL
ncbi:MAG TPA: hypothetical protein PK992_00440, partial [Planctomycetaceae bacterium]|nr:hypothetical protein [Planctomycetaceae bacterium]